MAYLGKTAVLILAAGAATRMGEAKQLLPWEDTTLLGNAVRTARACKTAHVLVVLGANAIAIKNRIAADQIDVTVNADWEKGLGSSIACGMTFLLKSYPKIEAVLIILADQPLVDATLLKTILNTDTSNLRGVATAYANKLGVPALFPQAYFKKLTTLQDDFGAKYIINDTANRFLGVPAHNKVRDIDTKSDYEEVKKIGKATGRL